MRLFGFSILAALLISVSPALAQQASANLGNLGGFPNGITVNVTADVPIDTWMESASFDTPNNGKAEHFAAALRAAGIAASDITLAPGYDFHGAYVAVTAVFPTALGSRVTQLARESGVTQPMVQMVPADPQRLYDRAAALAIERGRVTAAAIAAADGRHVGRLLNFVPSPAEFAKQIAASSSPSWMAGTQQTGKITASGIATFELMP